MWEDCHERLVGFFVLTSSSFQHSKCTWLEDFFHFVFCCQISSQDLIVRKLDAVSKYDGVITINDHQSALVLSCLYNLSPSNKHISGFDSIWRRQRRPLLSIYRAATSTVERFNEILYSGCFSCELDPCSGISTSCAINQKVVENNSEEDSQTSCHRWDCLWSMPISPEV